MLSEADLAHINRRSRRGLYWALGSQAFAGFLVALVAWGIAGLDAGASALLGAVAYFVPNAFFAKRLLAGFTRPVRSGPLAFFWGEAIKLATAGAAVGLMAWYWGDWLVWPAFLLGLLGVTKGYVVLMLLRRLP